MNEIFYHIIMGIINGLILSFFYLRSLRKMDRERELIKDLTQETINSYENSYRILCKAFKQDIYDLKKEIHDLQKKQEPFKNTKRQSEKKK